MAEDDGTPRTYDSGDFSHTSFLVRIRGDDLANDAVETGVRKRQAFGDAADEGQRGRRLDLWLGERRRDANAGTPALLGKTKLRAGPAPDVEDARPGRERSEVEIVENVVVPVLRSVAHGQILDNRGTPQRFFWET